MAICLMRLPTSPDLDVWLSCGNSRRERRRIDAQHSVVLLISQSRSWTSNATSDLRNTLAVDHAMQPCRRYKRGRGPKAVKKIKGMGIVCLLLIMSSFSILFVCDFQRVLALVKVM